jgi:histone acetyltransferase (RNA polymerase elongator complex component)
MTRRGHKAADTRNAVTFLRQMNVTIGLQLMLGLPGDTDNDVINSAKQIITLSPNFVRIYPTLVLKDSLLAHWYYKKKYIPLSLSKAVEQAKKLFLLFYKHRITVSRMGLQASEELNQSDTVLAGPYHPSFGHMVWSAIYLDAMRRLLSNPPQKVSSTRIYANPRDISKIRGLKNQNLNIIKTEFKLSALDIIPDTTMPLATLSLEKREMIHVLE